MSEGNGRKAIRRAGARPAAVPQPAPSVQTDRGPVPSPLSLGAGASLRRAPLVQLRLEVNQPGDAFEREAEAVADRVMRAAEPAEKQEGNPSAS